VNFSSADVPSFDCPFPEGSDMAICTMSIDFRTGGSRPLGEQVKHSAAGTPFGECLGDRTIFPGFGTVWESQDWVLATYSYLEGSLELCDRNHTFWDFP